MRSSRIHIYLQKSDVFALKPKTQCNGHKKLGFFFTLEMSSHGPPQGYLVMIPKMSPMTKIQPPQENQRNPRGNQEIMPI